MKNINWNPFHGCHKHSEGCLNCYVYRRDKKYDLDSSKVYKTKDFDMITKRYKNGEYKYFCNGLVYTCFTSDFFLEEADEWRKDLWRMIYERSDLHFLFITKRIDRFYVSLPPNWGDGFDNVTICCTVENQKRADYRLPIFNSLPIKHKCIVCEPLLENIDLSNYLNSSINKVIVGGESGNEARVCNYDWVLNIRKQCNEKKVKFYFKQTGAKLLKDNKLYRIKRKYQHSQARKAKININ